MVMTYRTFHPEHDMAKVPTYVQNYIKYLQKELAYKTEMIATMGAHPDCRDTECSWSAVLELGVVHPLPAGSSLKVMIPGVNRQYEVKLQKAFKQRYAEVSTQSGRLVIQPRAANLIQITVDEH